MLRMQPSAACNIPFAGGHGKCGTREPAGEQAQQVLHIQNKVLEASVLPCLKNEYKLKYCTTLLEYTSDEVFDDEEGGIYSGWHRKPRSEGNGLPAVQYNLSTGDSALAFSKQPTDANPI